jgi:hypothetical protein
MEIALALDTYDDIFSDFDPRGYGERALSRDFLDELRLRSRRYGRRQKLALVFLVPEAERDADAEVVVAARMRSFFHERRTHYLRLGRSSRLSAAIFVLTGLALSLGANFVAASLSVLPLFSDFLLIPAWFFVWNGLQHFVTDRKEVSGKIRYYDALSAATIDFRDLRRGVDSGLMGADSV